MFMGTYQNQTDAKNRIIVPAKFRDELGYKCVLTRGFDKCLYIYPMAQWEKFMEKIAGLPSADPQTRGFLRHFYASAMECDIDKQGRMTLPQNLREYAGIDKELVTLGVMDKIEIWSRELYDSEEDGPMMDPSEFAQKMAEYGI